MNEEIAKRHAAQRDRIKAERRLRSFYGPQKRTLDPRQVEASRRFHIQHWLKLAESVVQRDHRHSYYGGLMQELKTTLADYPSDEFPPEMQQTLLNDLAFLEGHLQAFRDVVRMLEDLRKQAR